ncbi:putative phage resistance protein [Corynebacterium renale]|uniref:AAA family ATPase n=1 Tax=Corynebacterium renale TaxID=1724 RepID=UPI000DA2FF0F|nr:ATP-binding protein [Corynebacterium renale]SQG64564.1 putative phage resistance protein [Corynebacterium renale]STC95587.1 putative phage resistance protein [Corynebacterium renale]
MLLDLTVTNVLSFNEPTSLNLIPGREQRGSSQLPLLKERYNRKVNPIAALFGANASGKSNVTKTLDMLKQVVDPRRRVVADRLPYVPFLLDTDNRGEPSRIEILFEQDGYIYEYGVSYTAENIVEEWLELFLSRGSKSVFERRDGQVWLDGAADPVRDPDDMLNVLAFTVPDHETLVRHIAEAKTVNAPTRLRSTIERITTPNRFLQRMLIVDSNFGSTGGFSTNMDTDWGDAITRIDAGIVGLTTKEVDIASLGLDEKEIEHYKQLCSDGSVTDAELPSGRYRFAVEDGNLKAEEVRLVHAGDKGHSALPWLLESDGTKGVSRLFPLFEELQRDGSGLILVIDELDNSFHTELSLALLDGFLNTRTPESRSQLIFTSHDLLLMDPSRLRKDQIWVVEKGRQGATAITPLSDFENLRSDKDLRKAYVQGRFGGVPDIAPLYFGAK